MPLLKELPSNSPPDCWTPFRGGKKPANTHPKPPLKGEVASAVSRKADDGEVNPVKQTPAILHPPKASPERGGGIRRLTEGG